MAEPVEELSYGLGDTGFESQKRHEIYLFSKTTRPPPGTTQTTNSVATGGFIPGSKAAGT
jgi:hypothetical protein